MFPSWLVPLLLLLATVGGCASDARFPENPPLLTRPAPASTPPASGEDELLLLVTFSGGGSRAAALAYGVLRQLAATRIQVKGSTVRLIDQIDMLSAVSGGSITAAYFGLYGDRLFLDFRPLFLERDVESELRSLLFSPGNLSRLSSESFGRSEILSEYLDKTLFQGQTLRTLVDDQGPYVEINATDLFKGSRFGFSPEQFALICSDIDEFPAARAVAASSAVPLLLSPVTLLNRAGSCDIPVPDWITRGLNEKGINNRRYRAALNQSALLDAADHPFIHLVDGGLADNLGLRAILDRIVINGGIHSTLQRYGHQNATRIVLIVVNASAIPPTRWERSSAGLPQAAILDAATTAPLANYNFETLQFLYSRMDAWKEEIRKARCASADKCAGVELYLIELSLENLADPERRQRLTAVPTGFSLDPDSVEELVEAGGELLRSHDRFRRFILDHP